jgi:hypothetical protein
MLHLRQRISIRASSLSREHLGCQTNGLQLPFVLGHGFAFGHPLQENPRQPWNPARQRHAADREIDEARDHGRKQERIGPPIFRRRRIFGDAVEELIRWQHCGFFTATMHGQFVEGLHADDHDERETSNDYAGKHSVRECEKIGPPPAEFQAAPQQRPREAKQGPVERAQGKRATGERRNWTFASLRLILPR